MLQLLQGRLCRTITQHISAVKSLLSIGTTICDYPKPNLSRLDTPPHAEYPYAWSLTVPINYLWLSPYSAFAETVLKTCVTKNF